MKDLTGYQTSLKIVRNDVAEWMKTPSLITHGKDIEVAIMMNNPLANLLWLHIPSVLFPCFIFIENIVFVGVLCCQW